MPAAKDRARLYTKSSKLTEIEKPRGFARDLPLAAICGAAIEPASGRLLFLLRWHDCAELDLVAAAEVNERHPAEVIAYYEANSGLVRKCDERRRICERAEEALLEHPPTEPQPVSPGVAAALQALVADTVDEDAADADEQASAEAPTTAAPAADESQQLDASMGDTNDFDEQQPPAATDESMPTEPAAGAQTPTMDEDPNDEFLSAVASAATEHQARVEALPDDIQMPEVDF